ncbi:MAG: murein L,D-transpeptidase catalytic domain family protein [Moraxellaceae bacterium]|nr:murein L,D-transpeptidase catalytic domain family protein [Moraxellaceae bacterium]
MHRHLAAFLFACLCASPALAASLAERLQSSAPDANPAVITLAVQALQCATANGSAAPEKLAVIDYSLPSSQRRLWVFDIGSGALLFHELVAHGRNSGEDATTHFSNTPDSRATSFGLFRTEGTYKGSNGYSLRLAGLESGVNDKAMERAIVMHGAPYVNEEVVQKLGRLGRSWGCPAVRAGIAVQMIDTLKGGQLLFSYYPDKAWLASSRFLNCPAQTASR